MSNEELDPDKHSGGEDGRWQKEDCKEVFFILASISHKRRSLCAWNRVSFWQKTVKTDRMQRMIKSRTPNGMASHGDELPEDQGQPPEVITIHPLVWALRNAQQAITRIWNDDPAEKRHEATLESLIQRALFEGDVSAMGQLASAKDRKAFLDLPDALRGDPVALASIAQAFSDIGCHDYASAFSELAGNGTWPWSAAYRVNLNEKSSAAIVARLRKIIPRSANDTKGKK